MELRDIEYFAVVAEHGNVTRASEALELTPTAVSKSLRRLEKSIGAKVVKRTPKGVELTAVGSALLAQVRRLRLTLQDVAREAADLGQGRAGHLRIGTGPLVCEELLRVYRAMLKDAPDVTLDITVTGNDELVPLLRKGELDLIFSDYAGPYEGMMVTEPLFQDVFVVCAAANHPLARLKRVTLEDLTRERWALPVQNLLPHHIVQRAFREHGLPPPQVAIQTRSFAVRVRAWATTNLLGYMCRRVIQASPPQFRLVELPVKELTSRRNYRVVYRKDAYLSPAARRFIEILKAVAN